MKDSYWIAIAVAALIVGFLVGYGTWGSSAAKLPEVEKELKTVQSQMAEFKKKTGELESNLGKITNEKLNLEKENAELKEAKEALEKASKKGR
ncbi:MAG: hypothetical protein ACREQA_13080 [Candidatus Binatia bacterium]